MSNHKLVSWKRFWYQRGTSINLGDGGYLIDPDWEHAKYYNPGLVPFSNLSQTPCLALLAEPGMGKTQTLTCLERPRIEQELAQQGDDSLWLDLGAFGENRLVKKLFDSQKFQDWLQGSNNLYIFLDSLDEGLLSIATLSKLLITEFVECKAHTHRLKLRISCRTSVWPAFLEDGLKQMWGEKHFAAYELAPLRKCDVVGFLQENGVSDAQAFLEEVEKKQVTSFAIKPVTLQMLVNIYRANNQFPSTRQELYHQGCLLLCEEENKARLESRNSNFVGKYSANVRMEAAAKMAAITIFSNCEAIWTGVDAGDVPSNDVRVDEFSLPGELINETFDHTGLFSSRGPRRLGWAHRSYAEFLAAWYLNERLKPVQLMSLLADSEDSSKRIFPQLHETAAWLASMNQEIFNQILQTDPDVLLLGDIEAFENNYRKNLVGQFLHLVEQRKLNDENERNYAKLYHPELVEQLRPYLADPGKEFFARRAAMDIARSCKLRDLQEDLLAVAIDAFQDVWIRVPAVKALVQLCDEAAKPQLKPLALDQPKDDPYSQIKGYALEAVWPLYMTATELFDALTEPEEYLGGGAYSQFLQSDFVHSLQPADLQYALKWVERNPFDRREMGSILGGVRTRITERAWVYLDYPDVATALAKAELRELDQYHKSLLFDELLADNEKRLSFIKVLVAILPKPEKDGWWITFFSSNVIQSQDIPWLLSQFETALPEAQEKYAQFIYLAFRKGGVNYFDQIVGECWKNSILGAIFSYFWQPVELGSEKAKKEAEQYQQQQEWAKERKRPVLSPPPAERVEALLQRFESGNLNAWWQLNRDLTLKPDSLYYENDFKVDITKFPGWEAASSTTRSRIIDAAKQYILQGNPNPQKWLGDVNTLYFPAMAGYRAFFLLNQTYPNFIDNLSAKVWETWASTILHYSEYGNSEQEIRNNLIQNTYRQAPQEFLDTLEKLIDKAVKEGRGDISVLHRVEQCWDENLSSRLMAKVKDPQLKPAWVGYLLRSLLKHQVKEARKYTEKLLSKWKNASEQDAACASWAAHELWNYPDASTWSQIWPLIQSSTELGQGLVESLATREASFIWIPEQGLGDLYIWLAKHYPHAADPPLRSGFVSNRDDIRWWRDGIMRHLRDIGTRSACYTIQRVLLELPHLDFLKWYLIDAERNARRNQWSPLSPAGLLKLMESSDNRSIHSEAELLEVVMESLQRLEMIFRGETPAVVDLWNTRGGWTPKEENEVSDYVKRYLERDLGQSGIIVNREVEIRRKLTDRAEEVDIRVDTFVKKTDGSRTHQVSILIETKGCWNQYLKEAMNDQLIERYLRDNHCGHGIYLIGWFLCDKWDNSDKDRKNRARNLFSDKNQAEQFFNTQAETLSREKSVQVRVCVLDVTPRQSINSPVQTTQAPPKKRGRPRKKPNDQP